MSETTEFETSAKLSGLADNEITEKIIGAAIEVHRHLGPGLLESAYEECFCYELRQMGIAFERQVRLPIQYKGLRIESAHKMDVVVEDSVVVEIKATDGIAPVHCAQLLTYLKFFGKRVGLVINFNVPVLKDGLKRVVNHYAGPGLPSRDSAATTLDELTVQPHEFSSELSDSSPRFAPRLRVSASKEDVA
jgi:GxxExxY protein